MAKLSVTQFVVQGLLLAVVACTLQSQLHFHEYCTLYGYPVQEHIVHTADGYNLVFYRIQEKNTAIVKDKSVVYLQHGLVDSADTWIVNEESLAPAFVLANLGYDVWLGNSRGNRYSNAKINSRVRNFWEFTFDQMAQYDLPAAFVYIQGQTGRKIHYIGHSQGTLIMFIALSKHYPDIQTNLLSFSAFGPVAYLKHMQSKLFIALDKIYAGQILKDSGAKYALLLPDSGLRVTSRICRTTPTVCIDGLKYISQMNNTVNNLGRLPVIMGHFPSGSSINNLVHFDQYVRKESFAAFDYGAKGNIAKYGQETPPLYNISAITFPVHLYVGKYDKLADVEDCNRLFAELTSSPNKSMKIYEFGHATFVWGKSLQHLHDAVQVIRRSELNNSENKPNTAEWQKETEAQDDQLTI